ncbi:MAG: UvrD-helicase domain-containing protein, partial [Spirochaetales bacterium]|nr:UvrD-helicase domain-containing protein [Spirochaetales bacterium]
MRHYLQALNEKQQEAVLHSGSPLLILAGAGSGKTRVITTKIAYLIEEKKVDPRSILAVTFTNKAANEMKSRVLDMVSTESDIMIRTFHSFGAWLLRRNSHLLNLAPHFTIFDDDDSLRLVKTIMGKGVKVSYCKYFLSKIKQAKNECLSYNDSELANNEEDRFLEVYRNYQTRLESMGNADFGDLLSRSVELLRNNPAVRDRYRSRFTTILVDEFQDSNLAQLYLLKELYSPGHYLCVVGDEDQSIYSFRGAEVRNILDFDKMFPDTTIVRLEQNYRSGSNILQAAGSVVSCNRDRLGKTLWTSNPPGELIDLFMANNEDEEARYCAGVLSDGGLSHTAICYRNNYQSRAFESLFSKLNIPYKIVGSVRFYEREEVKDVLAYLYFMLNPKDEISFKRIINKPSRGLGEKT